MGIFNSNNVLYDDIDMERNKTKNIQKSYDKIKEEFSDLQKKYIKVLEEKGKGFDQYIQYYNQCLDFKEEKKEIKGDLLDIKKEFNNFKLEVKDYISTIYYNYLPKLSKVTKKDEFYLILWALFYMKEEDNLPKGIIILCKRLNITKSEIKKYNEELYNTFNVNKWEIEE